jgi:hypothetical protein
MSALDESPTIEFFVTIVYTIVDSNGNQVIDTKQKNRVRVEDFVKLIVINEIGHNSKVSTDYRIDYGAKQIYPEFRIGFIGKFSQNDIDVIISRIQKKVSNKSGTLFADYLFTFEDMYVDYSSSGMEIKEPAF